MMWGPAAGCLFVFMFVGTLDALRGRAYEARASFAHAAAL